MFNDTKTIADYGYSAQEQVFKKAGEEIATIELQYRKYGIVGAKKSISVPIIATEDIMYYKNDINDKNAKIEYNIDSKSAWKMANKEIELNFNLPNYSEKVKGKVDLSKLDLIKNYAMYIILFIITALLVIIMIGYCIRLRNLKRKRMRRRKNNKKSRC